MIPLKQLFLIVSSICLSLTSKIDLTNYLLLNFFIFSIEELLISKEFTDYAFTTTQTSSWSISKVYTCPSTYVIPDYSSQSFFGMFGGTERTSKTYSSLPPHWSLSLRFDILLFNSLESVDYVDIYIDSTAYGRY